MKEIRRFQSFGVQLKKIRLEANKTLDDVSGAVELSSDKLRQIELGSVRPKQGLIFLLAGYFNLSFPKTQQLLQLAGYDGNSAGDSQAKSRALFGNIPTRKIKDIQHFFFAISDLGEEKTVYTNETSVNVSNSGGGS